MSPGICLWSSVTVTSVKESIITLTYVITWLSKWFFKLGAAFQALFWLTFVSRLFLSQFKKQRIKLEEKLYLAYILILYTRVTIPLKSDHDSSQRYIAEQDGITILSTFFLDNISAKNLKSKLQQCYCVLFLHLQAKTVAYWKYLYLQLLQFDAKLSCVVWIGGLHLSSHAICMGITLVNSIYEDNTAC